MRTWNLRIAAALFLTGVLARGGDPSPAPLRLELALEGGPAFQPGDPIRVRLTVRPTGGGECTFTEELIGDLRERLVVEGPDGARLISGAELAYRPAVPPRSIKIGPADPFDRTVELTALYPRLPYRAQRPHCIRALGQYRVVFQGRTQATPAGGGAAWNGDVSSAPVAFTLVAPDDGRLERWRTILVSAASSLEEVRNTLRHVEFFGLEERLRLLKQVGQRSDHPLGPEVARALAELPPQCPGGFDLVKDMLQRTQDPFVRAELMAALEQFPCDEALQLLVREVSLRSERSYRAAVVILGRIGDANCVPVLEEVAAGDPTPWVRERARESVREVRQRSKQ